uniref:Uncharacterized protein n=1 Tax=Seriola dumerili TaxID=41447 RepID=A0A3B4UJH0_SERDU
MLVVSYSTLTEGCAQGKKTLICKDEANETTSGLSVDDPHNLFLQSTGDISFLQETHLGSSETLCIMYSILSFPRERESIEDPNGRYDKVFIRDHRF